MSEYGPTHNAEASKPLADWRDAEIERLRRDFDIEIEVNGVLRRELAEAQLAAASWKREAEINQEAADKSARYEAKLAEARELLAAALPFLEILQPDGEDAGPALNELLYGIDRVLGLDDEATAEPPQSGQSLD